MRVFTRGSLSCATLVTGLLVSVALTGCSALQSAVDNILPEPPQVTSLAVGDCFNNTVEMAGGGELTNLPTVSCTAAHDNEIISSVEMDDEEFPGSDAVIMRSFKECLPAFEAHIGTVFTEKGTLEYDFFTPTEASWALGDREILCFAFDSAAQTRGSLDGVAAGQEATGLSG